MSKASKSKIEKYRIYATSRTDDEGRVHWTWWARTPWGPVVGHKSWKEAVKYLTLRYNLMT